MTIFIVCIIFFVTKRLFVRIIYTKNKSYPVLHVFDKQYFIRRDSVFGRRFILQATGVMFSAGYVNR